MEEREGEREDNPTANRFEVGMAIIFQPSFILENCFTPPSPFCVLFDFFSPDPLPPPFFLFFYFPGPLLVTSLALALHWALTTIWLFSHQDNGCTPTCVRYLPLLWSLLCGPGAGLGHLAKRPWVTHHLHRSPHLSLPS